MLVPIGEVPYGNVGINSVDQAMGPAFYQVQGKSIILGQTDFGLSEFRMCLKGEEAVMGIKFSACAGDTTKDKLKAIGNMTFDDVVELAKANGFIYVSKANSSVLIPPGHIVCYINPTPDDKKDKQVHGLKYPVIKNAKCAQNAIEFLKQIKSNGDNSVQASLIDAMLPLFEKEAEA